MIRINPTIHFTQPAASPPPLACCPSSSRWWVVFLEWRRHKEKRAFDVTETMLNYGTVTAFCYLTLELWDR